MIAFHGYTESSQVEPLRNFDVDKISGLAQAASIDTTLKKSVVGADMVIIVKYPDRGFRVLLVSEFWLKSLCCMVSAKNSRIGNT